MAGIPPHCDGWEYIASVIERVEHHGFCRVPFSTKSPSQGDSDTRRGSREVRDPCYGHNNATDSRKLGNPPHHRGSDDAFSECVEWDLL